MDVNGTRYQLLLGRADWERCFDGSGRALGGAWDPSGLSDVSPIEWDATVGAVRLQQLVPLVASAPADAPPALDARRGADCDRFGNWYWVGDDVTELRVWSSGSQTSSHFWSSADEVAPATAARLGDFVPQPTEQPPPLTFGGLAVTSDHRLVVGVTDPPGLAIFDLLAGGGPQRLLWPSDVPFQPFDIAALPGGGAFVLDRVNARYWELDRVLLVRPLVASSPPDAESAADFAPLAGPTEGPPRPAALPISFDDSAPLAGDPIAIAAAPDGSALMLDRNPAGSTSLLRRYVDDAEAGDPVATGDPGIDLGYVGYDLALVPAAQPPVAGALGSLFVVAASGNQVFEHALAVAGTTLQAPLVRAYYPLRAFGGKALAADTQRAYYDFGDRWLPVVEQRRSSYLPAGTVLTAPLDGHVPGCVWHRLLVDASLPTDTSLTVWTRTAEAEQDLLLTDWRAEPDPIPRAAGSELPFATLPDGYQTWELLFQAAAGRYLQVRLDLAGDGRASPRLRALRAYYPRFSYPERYLPACYREDETSASFLERWLANPEGMLTGLEGRIAAAQALLDPRSAPAAALDWLAGWFEVALDPAWDEARRRLFIRHAMDFFQLRGTKHGIELALRLAFDTCVDETLFSLAAPPPQARSVTIVEWFRLRAGVAPDLGRPVDGDGLRALPLDEVWRPSHGADALDARFRLFLDPSDSGEAADVRYPTAVPSDPQAAALWEQFSSTALGFVPAAGADDVAIWQSFLQRRYRRVGTLAAAYGSYAASLESWDQIGLPAALPPSGGPLSDWFEFESVVLPTLRNAHRFSVLLPVPPPAPNDTTTIAANKALADRASRIVELEKPAHTVFDVRFFWTAFRLGAARLGTDTLLEGGSRDAALPAAVLDHAYVGQSVLTGRRPADLVATRDSVGARLGSRARPDERRGP